MGVGVGVLAGDVGELFRLKAGGAVGSLSEHTREPINTHQNVDL